MSVRPFLRGASLVATTVLVASCGSGDAGSSGETATSSSPSGPGGAFPVTVETAFGDVEIPAEPQRVVALGWSDAETALALGVQPVGASDWLAFGTEVAVGAYTSEGFGAYVRGDTRVDFMEALGFTNKAAVQDLAGEDFFVPISEEQVPLLDAPLTVVFPIFVDASQITDNPLWQSLRVVRQGNAVVLEDQTLVNAFSSGPAPGARSAPARCAAHEGVAAPRRSARRARPRPARPRRRPARSTRGRPR